MLQLDGTLITVALPSVAHGLGVKGSSTSVVLSAYFGAYALLLLPGGELVDRFGVRRLALVGLALFAVGAVAGALVTNFGELIAARIIQGAGAGLVSPAALAGAVSGFPRERRGSALGIWGASAGMSNLLGPLLGGLLTVAFGWRADWWALLPLTLLVAVAIVRLVPAVLEVDHDEGGQPSMNRIVLAATLVAALTFAVMIGSFYIAEQYLQRVAGFSALGASGALVLVALLVGAAAPLAGKLVDRRGEQFPAVLGFVGAGLGLVILGLPGVSLDGLVTILPLIPVGTRPGHAVRPHLARGLERQPPGVPRPDLGDPLGRTAARRGGGRRPGWGGLVRYADRLHRSPHAAARRRAVSGRRDPGLEPARRRQWRAPRRQGLARRLGADLAQHGCDLVWGVPEGNMTGVGQLDVADVAGQPRGSVDEPVVLGPDQRQRSGDLIELREPPGPHGLVDRDEAVGAGIGAYQPRRVGGRDALGVGDGA